MSRGSDLDLDHELFEIRLAEENYKKLIPDSNSIEDALRTYERIYPMWKQEKLGVFIFDIKYPA